MCRADRFSLCLAAWLGAGSGCGNRAVEIIGALPGDGDSGVDEGGGATACPASLAERLTIVTIPAGGHVAWQRKGYNGYPADERVALAVAPDGQAQVAWTEVSPNPTEGAAQPDPRGVHVTPLDGKLARRGDDVRIPTGREVGGLVAHDDGFALLVRDDDQGVPIGSGDDSPTIAYLLRHQDGQEKWKRPLSGSLSEDAAETLTVYSPFLEGQLIWNDSTYGAYFVVKRGQTDPTPGFWRDQLVFRDSFGRPAPLSVTHGCENNGGIRLIGDDAKVNLVNTIHPSIPAITGLCVQQAQQAVKLTRLEADKVVSEQEVEWAGYSGARLGSLLEVAGGYLVFWLSLGATNDHQGHDIRMARLDSNFDVVGGPTWISRTPGIEEWNLHVAPYGPNHFLMVYQAIAITGSPLSDYAVYLGSLLGTHLVLLDANGAPLADERVQGAPTTANAEPVVLPNRDVAWPFVNPAPDFSQPVRGPNGPGQTDLHIARVRYCE